MKDVPDEAGDPGRIAERYESLIEDVRQTVHEIADKLKPLTEDIEPPPLTD